jgi:hypothetical protein
MWVGTIGPPLNNILVPPLLLGDCRNSFFVFVSDRSRSGLAENLGQIRFS